MQIKFSTVECWGIGFLRLAVIDFAAQWMWMSCSVKQISLENDFVKTMYIKINTKLNNKKKNNKKTTK